VTDSLTGDRWIAPTQQHALGWDIFPMLAGRKGAYAHYLPDGGTAPTKWVDGWTRLTAEQVEAYWPGDGRHNVGVATGHRSGVWVLDVDAYFETEGEAREYVAEITGLTFPETLSVRTASGKWHFYFKMPANPTVKVKTQAGVWPLIDVRGDGGMAMGICSSVRDGDEMSYYEVATMAAPAYAPVALLDRVKGKEIARAEEALASTEKHIDEKASRIAESHMIEPELQRLRDLVRPWREGAGWHDACFEVACNLAEFANSAWCSLTIEEARRRFFEAAPAPERNWNPAHEWGQGVTKTAGQARPLPKNSDAADAAAAALMEAVPTVGQPGAATGQRRSGWAEPSFGPDEAPAPAARLRPALVGTPADRLAHARQVYRKWLGPKYDLDALHVSLAARAAHELEGEPVWVLTLSGSGNAKTEGLMPLGATTAYDDDDESYTKVCTVSEINGPAALLSGSSKKDTAKDATGGLLEYLGSSGVIVLKDFTSILSMHREKRAETLAALREVYDGSWSRQVGTDGGKSLGWWGKITLLGAVTSAYDSHHGVIASMGDRFALLRVDSDSRAVRLAATKQARLNTGREREMRREMQDAVEAVIAGLDRSAADVDMETLDALDLLADVVTNIRTTVEFDQGNRSAERAHQPEVGTRFGKMLVQIVRGGLAVGMNSEEALTLARRVGRDSAPPIRVECLMALAEHGPLTTHGVSTLVNKPNGTVDRALQALQLLGFITHRLGDPIFDGSRQGAWVWSLADDWQDAPGILNPSQPMEAS